jgi:hypothetical protein
MAGRKSPGVLVTSIYSDWKDKISYNIAREYNNYSLKYESSPEGLHKMIT